MMWYLLRIKQIFDKYSEDEMSVYAAQASYFIFLAAFPFLMLLLALIQFVPLIRVADLTEFLIRALPDNLTGLVLSIIDSLYSASTLTLLSASAITSIWSSSKGMLSIERGLNRVYGITGQRNYILRRIMCSIYTVLFTVMCVLCMVLLVFGEMLQERLFLLIPSLSRFSFLISPARTVVSLSILVLFFLAVYTVLPYKKLRFFHQLPGAVFSALGWAVFSMAFSVYFKYFGNYAVTYGSLTAVILLMLWLYSCICILFAGAQVNWFFSKLKEETRP